MKTYAVRKGEFCYITNAESPIEAVKLAIARTGQVFDDYTVFDWDCNATVVDVTRRAYVEV